MLRPIIILFFYRLFRKVYAMSNGMYLFLPIDRFLRTRSRNLLMYLDPLVSLRFSSFELASYTPYSVPFLSYQSCLTFSSHPSHKYHARTKYIDIQYHFIREYVEKGKLTLEYCETAKMVADALTKPLSKQRHQELVKRMGLCRFTETLRHHQPETSDQIAQKVEVLDYFEQSENYSQSGRKFGLLK